MIFGFFGFSKKIQKNTKNSQFLGQKRQQNVKITKKTKNTHFWYFEFVDENHQKRVKIFVF